MPKKKKKKRQQQKQRKQQRSAFARRQARKKKMTRIFIGAMIVLLSLAMTVTLIPGDLGGVFGGAPEAEIEDPDDPFAEDDPFAGEEVGGVACDGEVPAAAEEDKPQWDEPPEMAIDPDATYRATMETSCGTIVLELFAADSPETVNNFVFLAEEGFYDGVMFHRVAPGFVIQGGDPEGTGMGGPGYRFEDELDLAEERGYPMGTLAMANSGPDTNGSQFFITLEGAEHLDPLYAVFGEVVEGIEAVGRIAAVPVAPPDRPQQEIYIESVSIEALAADDADAEDDDTDDGDG